MQRQYWQFFWPLALTGLASVLATQFQNAVLASYPDAAKELWVFALASSVFGPFGALLVFVPQMATVLARSRRGHVVCFRFTVATCVAISLPLGAAALLPAGGRVLAAIFHLDEPTLAVVVRYLRFLLPLVVVNGMRQYFTGMLVQARRTGWITWLNLVFLGSMICMLLLGRNLGWRALPTLATAQVASSILHLGLLALLYATRYRLDGEPDETDVTYGQVLAFFWPVATTSLMFSLSRPVLYAFIGRTDDAEVTGAALRVAFDFAMLFQIQLNQFRHLFATFGRADPAGVRRFMVRVCVGATAIMAAVAFTPLSRLILGELMGLPAEPLRLAVQTLRILCITPLVITVRNYFHGQLICRKRTRGMAVGGILRVAAIYCAAGAMYWLGYLNHITAAVALQLGFLAEAVVCAPFLRRAAADQAETVPLSDAEP